jgi:hypothetical protein
MRHKNRLLRGDLLPFSCRYSQGWIPNIFHPKSSSAAPSGRCLPISITTVRLLNKEGYAPASVRDHVRVIVRFSRSLQRSDCEIRDLEEAVVERFLHHKPKSHCTARRPPYVGY